MAVQNEAKDPAAAALLAIEEALNLVKLDPEPAAGAEAAPSAPTLGGAGPFAADRDGFRPPAPR